MCPRPRDGAGVLRALDLPEGGPQGGSTQTDGVVSMGFSTFLMFFPWVFHVFLWFFSTVFHVFHGCSMGFPLCFTVFDGFSMVVSCFLSNNTGQTWLVMLQCC